MRQTPGSRNAPRLAEGAFAFFVVVSGGWLLQQSCERATRPESYPHHAGPPTEPGPIADRERAVLNVEEWNWKQSRDGERMVARGVATNVSDRALAGVTALVVFQASDNDVVSIKKASLSPAVILPGQRCSFEVVDTFQRAMRFARLQFLGGQGETLPWFDSSAGASAR